MIKKTQNLQEKKKEKKKKRKEKEERGERGKQKEMSLEYRGAFFMTYREEIPSHRGR